MFIIFLLFEVWLQGLINTPPAPRFEAQVLDKNISIGYGLAIGDVDGDRKPDILLADQKQFVWYRNGDWKRFVLAENLTERDNVCIAARDLDGDGKVEIAVGAQWNPGETSDTIQSGAVFYLIRPQDPTQPWESVRLPHEPTVHRMRWVKKANGASYLVVVPLHGRGNKNGEGQGVKIQAYQLPGNPRQTWPLFTLDNTLHLTHNLDVAETKANSRPDLYVASKEGVRFLSGFNPKQATSQTQKITGVEQATGEVRLGKHRGNSKFLATIEPMHGTTVAVYWLDKTATRQVLDENVKEGHALAAADFLGLGYDQVAAGWRNPNAENKVGIKLYVPGNQTNQPWQHYWIDENDMATEDLQVHDLNADGKPDIIAAGRATKNLKIYWNKS
ncbi:FG-GAP and VCBS repeat-containing protein [Adhaeribacter radiodurans]|uniref:VCBS repeat-containing protein n=1 Tax=Adhaeribacter radiodurans TaxID=2745197 RepID=A0A7L7L4Y5_9BACT|nr:FG-GAP and VCBS repeat-containing protein [Adhaeribacter radiodurans]QMU27840.1 VCBS repeat-containing protein [Adhaeribacter radiodurans]